VLELEGDILGIQVRDGEARESGTKGDEGRNAKNAELRRGDTPLEWERGVPGQGHGYPPPTLRK